MPQDPLTNPPDPRERFKGLVRAVPALGILTASVLGFNLAQMGSTLLLPFSKKAFRAFNRWIPDTWGGLTVTLSKLTHGIDVTITGDDIPADESAIVVVNHQQMSDIVFLLYLAKPRGRIGDMKWMVKDIIKYVPGVGWGLLFMDSFFVKRNWADDKESIQRTFARIKEYNVPLWLVSFVEGTRLTSDKLARSRNWAKENGRPPLDHLLLPRTKGFSATVEGLRSHIDAVYDVTIGYENGVPSLWQYVRGFARHAHLHARRFPINEIPEGREAVSDWLYERYREKDWLLDHFYEHGEFPKEHDG